MIQYGVKNFRKFDSKGFELSLAPITFLTGCNNSGKSSASKSLVLLSQMYKRLSSFNGKDIPWEELYIDFSDSTLGLGNYESALNFKAKSNEGITFSFSTYSDSIQRRVLVELVFKKREEEIHNRAHLCKFSITDENHKRIISGTVNDSRIISSFSGDAGIEIWFYQQTLYYLFNRVKDTLPRRLTKDVKSLLEGVKKPSIDWGALLYDYFGFTEDYKNEAIEDLLVSREDTPITLVERLCHILKAFRSSKAPFLESIDGNSKEECLQNLRKCISTCHDDKKETALSWLMALFSKSSFQAVSEYVFSSLYLINYDTGVIHHPETHSIWGSSYEAVFLSCVSNTLSEEELDALRKELAAIRNTKKELAPSKYTSLTRYVLYLESYSLVALYTSIGLFPTEPHDYYPSHLFPGRRLFERLMGFVLLDVFSPINYNENTMVFWNSNAEYLNFEGVNYIGTTSVSVKRLYPESDTSELLTRLVFKSDSDFSFTNKWLWKLGLGNTLEIVPAPHGVGYFIYIVSKRGKTTTRTLLADFGLGVSHMLVILLLIDAWGKKDGGYNHNRYPTFILEEPEAHLHPSFQSQLADIFLDAYKTYGLRFIIETHSEYLIRKSQVLVSQMGFKSNDESNTLAPFSAYYFPKTGKPYSLGYRKDGYFANSFGKGFYDESASLTFELL